MATASYPFPYPSAVTYPPPPFSGGHYPSPFPYTFSSYPAPASGFLPAPAYGGAPPAFSYAATYHHPPPAPAYTAATGFSPAPSYDPSTFPLQHHPIHFPYPQVPVPQPETTMPPATAPQSHASTLTTTPRTNLSSFPTPKYDSSTFPYDSPCLMREAKPIPTRFDPNRPPPAPSTSYDVLSQLSTPLDRPKQQKHKEGGMETKEDSGATFQIEKSAPAMPNFRCHGSKITMGSSTSGASINGEQLVHKHTGPEILSTDNTVRTSPTRERTPLQSSFDSLHGELSKLSAAVSQLAMAMGLQTTEAMVTGSPLSECTASEPLFSKQPTSAEASKPEQSQHITIVPSAPSHVASQVFEEMPTPITWQGNHGTTTREPVFDTYDDETDGTSTEFADVFVGIPEQQKFEDQQQVQVLKTLFEQLLRDCSKAPKTEQTSADMLDFTFEQQQQIDENTSVNVQQLRDPQLTVLVIHERRREWDPGASLPLMSRNNQYASQALQSASHAPILTGSSVTRFSVCKCLPFWVQNNTYVLWKSEIDMPTYISWDPGVLNILDLMLDEYTVPSNVQFMQRTAELSFLSFKACTQYMTPNGHNSVLQDTSFILQKAARFSQGNYFCFLYCSSLLKTEYCPMRCLWEFSVSCIKLRFKFGVPTHVPQQSCYCRVPSSQENHSIQFLWDPGILSLLNMPLGKTASPNQVHSGQSCLVTKEVEVNVDSDKPIISSERPTVGVSSLTNEDKPDNEWISMCVHKTLDNAFSVGDTEFAFPHVQVTNVARSIKPIDERSTQADSILFVQGATVHYADEISNIKKQDVLVNKHDISSSTLDVSFLMSDISPCVQPCDMSNEKEELLWDLGSLVGTTRYSICFLKSGVHEEYPLLPCIWDPGIEWFSYKRLNLFPWIPGSAIIILQQLHSKTISLLFSLEKGRQLQWDPGIKLLLSELLWLKTVSKGTEYALQHLLSMKFSTHDSTYFIDTVTTMCSPANLSQQERNYAAVLPF